MTKLRNFWAGKWDDSHIPYDFVKSGKTKALDDMLQPGKKVRVFYDEKNPNNEIRHIRATVDDEYIAYRVWRNRRWRYRIVHRYDFEYKYERGRLS